METTALTQFSVSIRPDSVNGILGLPPSPAGDLRAWQWKWPAQPAQQSCRAWPARGRFCDIAARPAHAVGGEGPRKGVRHQSACATAVARDRLGRDDNRAGRVADWLFWREHGRRRGVARRCHRPGSRACGGLTRRPSGSRRGDDIVPRARADIVDRREPRCPGHYAQS